MLGEGQEYINVTSSDRTYNIYFKTTRAGWQLARVVMVAEDAPNKALPHTIKLSDLGKRYNVHSYEDKLKTFSEEVGTWC